MPQLISNEFKLELAKLEQDTMIELWEVDLRNLTDQDGMNGELYRFYAGTNEELKPIVWQGKKYQPFGVKADGFETSGTGTSNRPNLTIANINGFVTGLVNRFEQCLGAVVRRHLVYAQYLDAENFSEGNDNADPSQEVLSYFVVEQLSALKREIATFVLALPTETDNAIIPLRTVTIACHWVYRSSECGYTGGAIADEKDQRTSDIKKDKCSGLISGCKLRNNTMNYGGFISVNKLR
ncbi:phage minor tail protein L [Phocoenobacter skyensis]|uniref:Lambda-like phage minor tail protein L n=1 Tax=Phocoenobacter skyensis TaxID=97481 RepID=A0A1H8A1K2_9PAST|nr:phage minor tail protein L [Pasteurella skyensis]MDP8184415.1 phage minor tail protein L [Pasteurella skyensis]QLB22584.1 phage minor tail protein L [Pasteurella skyensis]SEM63669.1 lambda-like phage minor tail protein L [Pasteurella skyensis]